MPEHITRPMTRCKQCRAWQTIAPIDLQQNLVITVDPAYVQPPEAHVEPVILTSCGGCGGTLELVDWDAHAKTLPHKEYDRSKDPVAAPKEK